MRAVTSIHAANYYRKRRNCTHSGNWPSRLDLYSISRSQGTLRGVVFAKFLAHPTTPVARSLSKGELTSRWLYRGIIKTKICAFVQLIHLEEIIRRYFNATLNETIMFRLPRIHLHIIGTRVPNGWKEKKLLNNIFRILWSLLLNIYSANFSSVLTIINSPNICVWQFCEIYTLEKKVYSKVIAFLPNFLVSKFFEEFTTGFCQAKI